MESLLNQETTLCENRVQDPDLALVEASRCGDTRAFEELVNRYDRKLLRLAQRMTSHQQDAEDVIQETFLKAYQALSHFEGKSKFSTWIMRIAMNEALMKLRKRRTLPPEISVDDRGPDEGDWPVDLADWSPNPEQLFERSELHRILGKALDELRPSLRVVFVLRDLEELPIAETAAILELQPTAVKTRLLRARLHLREKLSRYFRRDSNNDR